MWLVGLALCATPAFAQSAEDVAKGAVMTPVEDVNLKKREIPPILLSAMEDPYSAEGTRRCGQLTTALSALDAVLGPDFDSDTPEQRRIRADQIAKSVVGSFIPFRGVVREVTGAAGAERRYQSAVDAGIARRGYLRGVARARGCRTSSTKLAASS
jgi:hypothetical protein